METPKTLFHTTLRVVDWHTDGSGATIKVYVLGTHSTLTSTKEFTRHALTKLGYDRTEFKSFEEKPASGEWKHGDGCLVYAKAEAGQEFFVGIDTKPNNENLPANPDGHVVLPEGRDHLHYVVQTKIDYNKDRSGAEQSSEIEGTYMKRSDAIAAAKKCLNKDDFEEFEERDSPEEKAEWPFGEDVVVHAVAASGENYNVAVKTPPGSHKPHHKDQDE